MNICYKISSITKSLLRYEPSSIGMKVQQQPQQHQFPQAQAQQLVQHQPFKQLQTTPKYQKKM